MAVTIQQLETLVHKDYEHLCQAASLTPVPRDIYQIIEGSQDLTQVPLVGGGIGAQ